MPHRLPLLLCVIIPVLGLTRCDDQLHYRETPFWVQYHFQQLSDWQYPQKIEIDRKNRKVYWLNKQGEIRAIGMNAQGEVLINKGIGAQLGITFISDFAIDNQNEALYFTDLMDVSTGQPALKKSDLTGSHIEMVTTFSGETAYALYWNNENGQLYYATRQKNGQLHKIHQLGKPGLLVTTQQKIGDIAKYIVLPEGQNRQVPLVAENSSVSTTRNSYAIQ